MARFVYGGQICIKAGIMMCRGGQVYGILFVMFWVSIKIRSAERHKVLRISVRKGFVLRIFVNYIAC